MFDRRRLAQAEPTLFCPQWWGESAQRISQGGRGSAWFIDAPFGACVLKRYRRGGLVAKLSKDWYLWQGGKRTRSFVEYCLMSQLSRRHLPVPKPIAAWYQRQGLRYQAGLLMERLTAVRSLAAWAQCQGHAAPWEQAGRLIAQFHRAGLDHADLNAHNILFDSSERGWLIDFDRCRLRIPATRWRERNLARLLRSLMKRRGQRRVADVEKDFVRLRRAYEMAWGRGC